MSACTRGGPTKRQSAAAAISELNVQQSSGERTPGGDEIINAVIADSIGDPARLLARALEGAGLWDDLRRTVATAVMDPASLRIVVKPELGAFAPGSAAATDPAMVELLIDVLHDVGFTNVTIVAARDSSALWAENRDVLVLADLLGYRFSTEKGRVYDIVDLGEDLVPGGFPDAGVLGGSSIAHTWAEAQYRIVFAKNRTDEQDGYALCLYSLIGVLPLEDKDYHYQHRFGAGEVAVEVLRKTPVQFAIIDAIVSVHGSSGSRAPTGVETGTVIASRDLLLADYAGAVKMGLDPYASPVNARALRALGLPRKFRIDGSLAPYANWQNVHPLIVDSTRKRNEWVGAARTLKPWLQSLDHELFPLKNPADEKLNGVIAPYFAKPDENPVAFWTLVALNYSLAGVFRNLECYRTLFHKDGLRRRETTLGLDLAQFSPADYHQVADELQPIAALVGSVPPDANGLRWRYFDEAIVFEYARFIPVPFEEFAAKVDISRTIQFMHDYIGGAAVPVAHNEAGRVTHQAERNLYLPQPNYLVLYQGDVIDVTKLEYAIYGADEQRMFWKTIKSENGSARYDDGIVTFARVGGATRISICGRQLFTLPPFWQAVNLDLTPELKTILVTDAYTTFFRGTMANLEAIAEGRDVRIGRPWHDPVVAPGTERLPVDRLAGSLMHLKEKLGEDWLDSAKDLFRLKLGKALPAVVDADGFRHFRAPAPSDRGEGLSVADTAVSCSMRAVAGQVVALWRDLADALYKDFAMAARNWTSSHE